MPVSTRPVVARPTRQEFVRNMSPTSHVALLYRDASSPKYMKSLPPVPDASLLNSATASTSSSGTDTPEIGVDIQMRSSSWTPGPKESRKHQDKGRKMGLLEDLATDGQRREPPAATWASSKKWTLGTLFWKKSKRGTECCQAEHDDRLLDEIEGPGRVSISVTSSRTETPRPPARTNTDQFKAKTKPRVRRSVTAPSKSSATGWRILQDKKRAPVPSETTSLGTPRLHVDIPCTEMERYSVMFGSVLRPDSSNSALLSRRQAILERLETVNEAVEAHDLGESDISDASILLRAGRLSQPSTPSFSLFPSTNPHHDDTALTSVRFLSGLQRSNTSPAALSPRGSEFPWDSSIAHDRYTTSAKLPITSFYHEAPVNVAQAGLLRSSHADQPEFCTHSPPDDDDHTIFPYAPEPGDAKPFVDRFASTGLPTPPQSVISDDSPRQFDMPYRSMSASDKSMTPAPSTRSPSSASVLSSGSTSDPPAAQERDCSNNNDHSFNEMLDTAGFPMPPGSGTTMSSDAFTGRHDHQAISQAEAAIENAASISIARQISVSKRQRQLLIPIKARSRAATIEKGSSKGAKSLRSGHSRENMGSDVKGSDPEERKPLVSTQPHSREAHLLDYSGPVTTPRGTESGRYGTNTSLAAPPHTNASRATSPAPCPPAHAPYSSTKKAGSVRAACRRAVPTSRIRTPPPPRPIRSTPPSPEPPTRSFVLNRSSTGHVIELRIGDEKVEVKQGRKVMTPVVVNVETDAADYFGHASQAAREESDCRVGVAAGGGNVTTGLTKSGRLNHAYRKSEVVVIEDV